MSVESISCIKSGKHVRKLVRASVREVKLRDDRVQACFDTITKQAGIFAEEMLLQGVLSDMFLDKASRRQVEPGAWYKSAKYVADKMPVWAIRHGSKYGGGKLPYESGEVYSILGISGQKDSLGKLVLVTGLDCTRPEIDSSRSFAATEILNPQKFMYQDGTQTILSEWAADLENAAKNYSLGILNANHLRKR